MVSYGLRDDLSFCLVNGFPIFLDMGNDRYFRLSGNIEPSFMAWLKNACEESDIAPLVERKILTTSSTRKKNLFVSVQRPQVSALELPFPSIACTPSTLIEVLVTIGWTQFQLRTKGIKAATEIWSEPDNEPNPTATVDNNRSTLLASTHDFLQARRLLPIGTRCLPDSIAMAKFLNRRHMRVNVVIGVTGTPFSAHCWVQLGAMVLNDTLGNVKMYSPIRVL